MKRVILCALLAATAGASGSALASGGAGTAGDDTGAWYISPLLQYTLLDDRRISKDNAGYQIGLGNDFAPNFAAEVALSNGIYSIKGSGASEKLNALSLDFMYKFLPPSSMFRPYALLGPGLMEDNIGGHGPTNKGWLGEAGVGVLMGLGDQTGSTRFQLRTEAKYRRSFFQNTAYIPNNPGDVVFGVGLNFMFGAPVPAPVVAAAPPPPPPEPPPPPPPPPEPAPAPCHAPAGFQVDANCHIIEQKVVVRAVDFEFNSAQLTAPAEETLDDVASALANQPDLSVEIQGYTDSVGSDAYNLHLSQKRAESVRTYLIGKGVGASALTAKGYGKADPIASNATAEGRTQNRRVAFQVTNAPAHVKVVTEDASAASTEAASQAAPSKAKTKKKEHQ